MLRLAPSWRFKRDMKRAIKRGKDLSKLTTVLALLLFGSPLPAA
jgi:mRNA-degrading endonuclease YafQ of YafQ-DinJ toxin-antitoxin module